jgi:glutathione peroxidase
MSPFYTFSAESLSGEAVALADYRDKVVLVVNTASQCGFTPQYAGLEALYQTYKEQGLVVLGFPCNQFGGQEPGDATEIAQTCQLNYGVTFPMFAKVNVNGSEAHPLFKWLVDAAPGLLGNAIKWNFTKFLINRQGDPVKRFAPITKPEALADDIQTLLKT